MTAAVPPLPLRAAWEEIDLTEQRIVAAIRAQDFGALASLADARHECILRFFEQFPAESHSAGLRLDLLQELTARNSSLLAESRAQLRTVSDASIEAGVARRALDAYRLQER